MESNHRAIRRARLWNTPPAKKAKTAKDTNTAQKIKEQTTDKFLCGERQIAQESLSQNSSHHDLDYVMKSVRGLIKINAEIWSACKEHMLPGSCVKMKRACYKEGIVVITSTTLAIRSKKELCLHDFGEPPAFPACLSNLISLAETPEVLPDYDSYLKKAVLLHDKVLVSFLIKFQKHLENVQIFLGHIESWMAEPESTVRFLNELFGENVASIETIDESMCRRSPRGDSDIDSDIDSEDDIDSDIDSEEDFEGDSEGEMAASTICIHCYNPYSSHPKHKRNYTSIKCSSGIPGLFYDPAATVLYSSTKVPEGSKMEMKFNLCTDDGKEKLKTFVAFLKMYQ